MFMDKNSKSWINPKRTSLWASNRNIALGKRHGKIRDTINRVNLLKLDSGRFTPFVVGSMDNNVRHPTIGIGIKSPIIVRYNESSRL